MWKKTKRGLYQKFTFKDFAEAFEFIKQIAHIAEQENHHPDIANTYNVVELWLSTHESGNVTSKDKELASQIDDITKKAPEVSQKRSAHSKMKLFADGGSRGNPGPSATGYALLDMDDTVVKKSGSYLGITTNNQAEYQAVREGLKEAKRQGVRELDVYLDSLLVVNQMTGKFKIKNRDLWPIHKDIKDLVEDFDKVTFTHVRREFNKLADAEVNEVLDAEMNKS